MSLDKFPGMGDGDFDTPEVSEVQKVIKCLKILATGNSLVIKGEEYKLAPTEHGGHMLIFKRRVNDTTDRWFGLDNSLDWFFTVCQKISDEALVVGLAESVLTQYNKNKN